MDRILRILNANEILRKNINEFKRAFIEYLIIIHLVV